MKAFVQTYGCQINEHDSRRMEAILGAMGYAMTSEVEEADVILVNTCSVRHNPENKVFSFLGALHPLKAAKPGLVIGVGGCVAQQLGESILKRNPDVDMVFGPDQYFRLPDMLDAVRAGHRVAWTEWGPRKPSVQNFIPDAWVEAGLVADHRASIAIMTGCNNFCSFCIVPYVRGREISREPGNILREARSLVARGAKEIWLLGQNVNSYHANGCDFRELLEALVKLPIARIRFTSPHPKDWDNALSDLMAREPVLCNQLHLPFQAGSNRILEIMNRRHRIEDYLAKVRYARSVIPNIEISTDLIVGFPTETDAEFEATLRVLDEVRFGQIFSFMYSVRPGTRAAQLEDDVPRSVKAERLQRVIARQEQINRELLGAYIGTPQRVLIDGAHPKQAGTFRGRTDGYRPVSLKDPTVGIGDLVDVTITGFHGHWLEATRDE